MTMPCVDPAQMNSILSKVRSGGVLAAHQGAHLLDLIKQLGESLTEALHARDAAAKALADVRATSARLIDAARVEGIENAAVARAETAELRRRLAAQVRATEFQADISRQRVRELETAVAQGRCCGHATAVERLTVALVMAGGVRPLASAASRPP